MKKFRLSAEIESDLNEIWLFVAQDNPDAANRLIELFLEKFLLIGKQPQIGRLRGDVKTELRSLSAGNYIIFYRDTESYVEFIRIIHGARDFSEIF